MIELIYLENSLYIKKLLSEAYSSYLDEDFDWCNPLEYEAFVERVFEDVINWYSWGMQEDSNMLALLSFDSEKAEDIIDSISGFNIAKLENWSLKFSVEYPESKNYIIIRMGHTTDSIVLPDPSIYKESYDKMRSTQLTKFSRLLNELRISKAGKLGKL